MSLNIDTNRTSEVVKQVENELEYIFSQDEVESVSAYTLRKCQLFGKDEDYFYLMLSDELVNYLSRTFVSNHSR